MDLSRHVEHMINELKTQGAIRTSGVETAFRRVPRHMLVEDFYLPGESPQLIKHDPSNPRPEDLDLIYSNQSLVTRFAGTKASSSTSEPLLMAWMLEWLKLSAGLKVLEIGSGTGYNAALISELVGDQLLVVSTDIQEDLVEKTRKLLAGAGYPNIILVAQDGFYGIPDKGPYDRIVATVGCTDLSPHWTNQITSSGFILLPLTHGGWTPLVKVWQEENRLKGKVIGFSSFMLIQGYTAEGQPWQYHSRTPFPLEKAQELPFFRDIQTEHTPRKLMWSAFPVGFYYFLAMRDSRAFWSFKPRGYGLYDHQHGAILISPQKGCVLLAGSRELYEELQGLYEEWSNIGKPTPFDYQMMFVPLSNEELTQPGFEWVIERKFYRQFLTISRKV